MIDFLIVYEHKVREMEGACLLKAELELKGYSVDIIQVNSVNTLKYLFWRKPKVVLPFALYGNKELYYNVYRIAGKVKKVVNLQWEQLRTIEGERQGYGIPKGLAKNAVHICWGNHSKQILKDNGVKNAIITGGLHTDLLKEKFIDCYMDRENLLGKYNIDSKKKVLLYISSFSYTTASERILESIKDIFDEKMVNELYTMQKINKKRTLEWIVQLLKEREDIVMIYRPHPSEFKDFVLEKIANQFENFKIISDYSVKQWILAADSSYTMFSTSIVEAYFANKQCYILRPTPLSEKTDYFIYKDAKVISTYDDFKSTLNEKKVDTFSINETNLMEYYETEGYSYQKICNLLEDVLNTDVYDMEVKENFLLFDLKEIVKILIKKSLLLVKPIKGFFLKLGMPFAVLEFYEINDYSVKEYISKKEIEDAVEMFKKKIFEERTE